MVNRTHLRARSDSCATPSPRWQPARGVLWCTYGDQTILLSLSTGQYYALSETGGRVWRHFCENCEVNRIAELIAADYGMEASPTPVIEDVEALLVELRKRRLVEHGPTRSRSESVHHQQRAAARAASVDTWLSAVGAGSPCGRHVPSLAVCVATLAVTHVLLRLCGLRPVLLHIYRTPDPSRLRDVEDDWLVETARRVAGARAFYPWRAECLEKSLSLLWLSRRAGADTKLRIGVAPYPFGAHAWVEHRGKPINDDPEHLRLYCHFPVIERETL